MPTYRWDTAANRYRDENGRFLSRERALQFVNQSLAAGGAATDTLADLVAGGSLSPADWRTRMREEFKVVYIQNYLSAVGGRQMMTPQMWGELGPLLREQYKYLDGFVDDIAAGNLTEAQIAARSRMYVNSAREAYERGNERVARNAGADEERWNLTAGAEHCPDCVEYAARDWQPVGTFPTPGDGTTQCKVNCACYKTFRIAATGEEVARFHPDEGWTFTTERTPIHA